MYNTIITLLSIIILTFPFNINAEVSVIAGAGQSDLYTDRPPGFWRQNGMDQFHDSSDPSWYIGLNWKVRPWLNVQLLYNDFGKRSWGGIACSDAAFYGGTPNSCPATGEIYGTYIGESEVRSFELTVLPQWQINKQWAIYGRLGLAWVRHTQIVRLLNNAENQRHFFPFQADGKASARPLVLGIGVEYGRVFVDYKEYSDISANSSFRNDRARMLSVGYKFKL